MAEKPGTAMEVRGQDAPAIVKLTPQDIALISENIKMAEQLTISVLEPGIDYGQIPGTPAPGLFDPGASKIINGFNCYPDYRVLRQVEEDGLISMVVQSLVVSRKTQIILGTGIGAASTRETKYKYRWVQDPRKEGYTPEQIKNLKSREKTVKGRPVVEYRIKNPEYGELVNTIAKMAAKRADVDAAQSLPGVSSALRKLFTGKIKPGQNQAPQRDDSPAWNRFWSQIAALGLTEEKAHEVLQVKSMKDWLGQGKSLNQAVVVLAQWVEEHPDEVAPPPEAAPAEEPTLDESSQSEHRPPPVPDRDPATVKTINDLYKVCNIDWDMQPAEVVKELGYTSQKDIVETPAECYIKIRAIKTR